MSTVTNNPVFSQSASFSADNTVFTKTQQDIATGPGYIGRDWIQDGNQSTTSLSNRTTSADNQDESKELKLTISTPSLSLPFTIGDYTTIDGGVMPASKQRISLTNVQFRSNSNGFSNKSNSFTVGGGLSYHYFSGTTYNYSSPSTNSSLTVSGLSYSYNPSTSTDTLASNFDFRVRIVEQEFTTNNLWNSEASITPALTGDALSYYLGNIFIFDGLDGDTIDPLTTTSSLTCEGGVIPGAIVQLTANTNASTSRTIEDYVATADADYVGVGYYIEGYAQNDPYVDFGYAEEPSNTINAGLLISATNFYAGDRTAKTVTTYGNIALSTAQSKFGSGSALITNTGDYFTVPGDSSLYNGNFTVEMWLYASNLTSIPNGNIWDNRTSSSSGMYLYVSYGSIGLGEGINIKGLTSAGFNNNQWNHIALVRNGTNAKVFVNGVQKISATVTTTNYSNRTSYIGSTYTGSTPMRSYFDEVRLSSSARYITGFTPSTSAFTSDSDTRFLTHLDGSYEDDIGYFPPATSDTQITITAKGSLTADTDLNTEVTVTASAGLTFSQETALATDTVTTASAGLTFSQTVSLAADAQVSPTGGNIITAASSVSGDAEISADVDIIIGSLATIESDSAVDAIGGFFITGAASVAGDITVTPIADVIFKPGANISSTSTMDATAKVDVYGALDVSGDGAVTVIAKGNLLGDIDVTTSFQFSAIANLSITAESDIASDTQVETNGGLIFDETLSIAGDATVSAIGGNIIGTTENYSSDFASNQSARLLLNGIGNFASTYTVPDTIPFRLVGGLPNTIQSSTSLSGSGTYTYDVPLIRRLTIPRDARLANILQETGILNVKSDTRINTVITELRALTVPKNSRTLKLYDGSL